MAVQEFDFASGKVLDPKRKQAVVASESSDDVAALKDILRQKGYQFLGQAQDIRAALELVRKHKLGVLFLDGDLPAVKLNDVVPSIKKAFPDFAIVVLSSAVTKELLSEVLRLGALGFLVKPVQGDALEKVLAKLK